MTSLALLKKPLATPAVALSNAKPAARRRARQAAFAASEPISVSAAPAGVIQAQFEPGLGPMGQPPLPERPFPPPNATTCGPTAGCPASFCEPYTDLNLALRQRNELAPLLMAGVAIAVDSRVVPLWRDHLFGGSAPRDLSTTFAGDFTRSLTTRVANERLMAALRRSIESSPPAFPPGVDEVRIDVASRIGAELAALGDPGHRNSMNFNVIGEVAGNIAGGVGTNQTTCRAGAQPSPFNDERRAEGTALIRRDGAGNLAIEPDITYTVRDTIDLCPGNCGADREQYATIPISQFEATGISGDVPFTIRFPANADAVVIPPSAAPTPPAAPSPGPVPGSP